MDASDNKENDCTAAGTPASSTEGAAGGKQTTSAPSTATVASFSNSSDPKNSPLESNQGTKLKLMKARNHVKNGEFDEAVELYGTALESNVRRYGDELSIHLAPLYQEYGSTLLKQAQTLFDMFGAKKTGNQNQGTNTSGQQESLSSATAAALTAHASSATSASAAATSGSVTSDDADDADSEQNGLTTEEEDERNELLEIAWETLETARTIYTNQGDTDSKQALVTVLTNLGDVSLENGQFSTAIKDYFGAIEHCREVYPESYRTLADLHTYIGLAYMFHADEASEEESSADLERAQEHYSMASDNMWNGLLATVSESEHAQQLREKLSQVKTENEQHLNEFRALPADERPKKDQIKLSSFADCARSVEGKGEGSESRMIEEADVLDGLYEKLWELSLDTTGRREKPGEAKEAAEAALSQVVQQMGDGEAAPGFSASSFQSSSSSSASVNHLQPKQSSASSSGAALASSSAASTSSSGTVNTLQPKHKGNTGSSSQVKEATAGPSSSEKRKEIEGESQNGEPEKKARTSE
eukprot:gb/GECG01009052.1/.p1 GENE.gb/GECG01009052.1/~~gb/GECG01009052.1/.p1  ORF type:complete len:531 (+),score=108.95 gb/GECG01009052.1/:1-1593(+)